MRDETGINSTWFLGLLHNQKVSRAAVLPGGPVSRTVFQYEDEKISSTREMARMTWKV